MDEDTREILSEWGLSEYIEIFKENKIDIQCLNILDNDMIKELIRPIGDRAKFTQNISLWKQIQGDSIPQQEPPQDTVYVDVLNEKHRNPPPLNNYENEVFTVTHTDVILSDTHVNLPLADVSNIQPSSEVYSLGCISPSTASTSATNETRNPSSKKLLDLLNKSNKGRNLLKLYKEEGLLTNNGRRVICNIVVEDLLSEDHEKRVPHATLLSTAQEIKAIFPKENISTYYIPYVNNSNMKIKTCAKGKLYDCLHNRKREYREAEKKNTCLKVDQLTNINKNTPNQTDQQEDVQQHIIWLQNSIEPWQMVQQKWQATATHRLKCLNNSDKTIEQYLTEFPALRNPAGYSLLTEDFKTLYPDKEGLLHEKFCFHKDNILSLAKQKARRDETIKNIIQKLENLPEDGENIRTTEAKTIIAFMLLPLLLGNPLSKVKKSSWRPSKQESSEGFITHIYDTSELQNTISSRRDKFFKLNVTLQPFIVIVGRDYTAINNYYVVVNNTYYVLHSIIDAVDVCFKIFHALSCRYPIECSSTWQFIQKALFNLQTPYDKQFVSVNALISDLEIEID